jgi:chromosome segregation ATPase
MPSEEAPNSTPQAASAETPATSEDVRVLPEWAQQRFTQLEQRLADVNNESAERRHRLKEMETQVKELSAAQQKRLAEQGNFEELARQRAAEVETLKPYEERAKALESVIRASNDARVAQVREDLRALVPADYSPEKLALWLDANWSRLTVKAAPDLDAGAGTANGRAIRLTDAERAQAKRSGLTEEEFASAKQKLAREG